MCANPVYPMVKEIKECTDLKEIARLLSSHNWVAIDAMQRKNDVLFVLGRVRAMPGDYKHGR